MQQVKVKGHSVQKSEWKQTDRDNCITSCANVVGNNSYLCGTSNHKIGPAFHTVSAGFPGLDLGAFKQTVRVNRALTYLGAQSL